MPTYCYSTLYSNQTFEREFPRGEAPQEITVDLGNGKGKTVACRDYEMENVRTRVVGGTGGPAGQRVSGWPMKPCFASGVHPSQAQELRDHYKKHGINVEVNQDGDPIYESSAQRKKALKCRGMVDKSSYC